MPIQHKELAAGRWQALTLAEQMGNIGSEINRAALWRGKNEESSRGAIVRALELMDFTIQDPRWRIRLKELTRVREMICDAYAGGCGYGATVQELDSYFSPFALLARRGR